MSIFASRSVYTAIAATVLGLIVIGVLFDKVIMPFVVNSARTEQVPNVVGMPKQQAIDMLESKGLKVEKVVETFNASAQHGVVLSQLPYPNSLVKEGRRVYLSVSKGYEVITMPDLSMMSQREAQLALLSMGLQVGSVSYDFKDSIPEDRVIRQSYLAGMSVGSGTVVNLVLSKDSNATVIAPSCLRLSEAEAMQSITDAQLTVGQVIQDANETYAPGTVTNQQPPAGTKIHRGSKIDIWVVKQ